MELNIRETKIVDIDYVKKGEKAQESFTLTQLNTQSGIKYMKKVQKIVLPVWAEASKGEGVTMADIIIKASEKLDELEESDITSLVCESLSITPKQFEEKFRGKYFLLLKLLKEIVWFNFEDVFIELGLEEI